MTSPATTSTSRWARGVVLPVAAVLAVMVFALNSSGYVVTVIGFAAIYAIFVTGLNFFMGYTGQASFGQNAFAALGGYGSAILSGNYYWDPLLALVVSMAFAGVVAAIVGYPTLKLRGHYLAMATFALGLITYEISIEWTGLTSGYMGISGIPPLGVGRYELGTEKQMLVALTAFLLLGVWISTRLRGSRFGRALRAIAGSEPAAQALGIQTVIDPYVAPERWQSADDVAAIAEQLNEAAAVAARYGVRVGYHNPAHELDSTIEGTTALQFFAGKLAPEVVLEVDTYWVAVGGHDPLTLLPALGDRVVALHIKDGPGTTETKDQVAVGQGSLPIADIIAAAPDALRVVELDDSRGDRFQAVADSYAFLTEKGLA